MPKDTEQTPKMQQVDSSAVLYFDNTATFGGAINSLGELVSELDPERYEPVVATAQSAELVAQRFPGVRTVPIKPLIWKSSGGSSTVRKKLRAAERLIRRTVPDAVAFARLGRKVDADILHLNNNMESQQAVVLASWWTGIPCVAHAQNFQRPARSLRWMANQVAGHVAISNAVKANLQEIGAPADRIRVIHHGIHPGSFADVPDPGTCRKRLGIPDDGPVFGTFGRIIPWKGIEEFVRASAEVIAARPDARAHVVGGISDGAEGYHERVKALAADLGVADRIVFAGYKADVRAWMGAMDIVVHAATRPEPFGLVLIEGMALGKPVVATRGGGPDDIMLPGRTGHLVGRGHIEEMRDAILDLIEDPARARQMGEEARGRVESQFSSERYAREVMEFYDDLLHSDGSEAPGGPRRTGNLDRA